MSLYSMGLLETQQRVTNDQRKGLDCAQDHANGTNTEPATRIMASAR